MAGRDPIIMNDKPPRKFTGTDAALLALCVLGILIGISILSYEAAIAVGVAMLGYVLVKLFTT